MWVHDIDPVLLDVGPLTVHWYGVMYLIGFAAAWWLGCVRARKPASGWTEDQVSDLIFWGAMGVVLGGRFGYVLFYNFDQFLVDPLWLFAVWEGGMSFHGGLLGVITVLWLWGRKHNKSLLQMGDFVAPLIPIGLGAGRIGNFIGGELWGRATDLSWGVVFPRAVDGVARHPSQLYEFALEGVVLFFILNWFIRKPRPLGAVSGLFLFGYGTFRFLVEYVRQPDAQLGLFGDWISMGQILSLPMVIGGLLMMIWAFKRNLFATDLKSSGTKSKKSKQKAK